MTQLETELADKILKEALKADGVNANHRRQALLDEYSTLVRAAESRRNTYRQTSTTATGVANLPE